MPRRLVMAVIVFLAPTIAAALTPWDEGQKHAYIDRCSKSMSSAGLSPQSAKVYCTCTAEGMSNEFGMEEYSQMIGAHPNPNGSPYDRRLYKVISTCNAMVPRQ